MRNKFAVIALSASLLAGIAAPTTFAASSDQSTKALSSSNTAYDLTVTYNSPTMQAQPTPTDYTTHYSAYWWGYKVYFSHADTQYLARILETGANERTVGVVISRILPQAPATLLTSASKFLYNMGSKQLRSIDAGYGIYIDLPLQGKYGK